MLNRVSLWFLTASLLLAALLPTGCSANAPDASLTSPAFSDGELQVFVRPGCPHCAEAERFLAKLAAEAPELRIRYREIGNDPAALPDLQRWAESNQITSLGVPSFVLNGRMLVGFDNGEFGERRLREWLSYAGTSPDRVEVPLFGQLNASSLGLPLFTLALGLIDGFNPCAMWVLLFLLALLLRLRDRRRLALIAGTFVVSSGLVYYAFMAAWLNLFMIVEMSERLRWLLGGLAILIGLVNSKDFFAWNLGPSLRIPEAARQGLYARLRSVLQAPSLPTAMALVASLAIAVNFVELLCTAGLPAIYTAVLAQQSLSPLVYYAYLGLYNLAYIADDGLMVSIAVLTLSSGRLTETTGRRLKLLSGILMLALGLAILLRPQWLI